MGIYLNPDNNRYERLCNSPIFVDKSLLIEYTNKAINTSNERHHQQVWVDINQIV